MATTDSINGAHVMNKPSHFSEAFYQRALNDPLDIYDPESVARLLEDDITGVKDAISRNDDREAGVFSADAAILSFLASSKNQREIIAAALDQNRGLLETEQSEQDYFAARSRMIDLSYLLNFSVFQSSKSQIEQINDPKERIEVLRKAERMLEAVAKSSIVESAKLMVEMHKAFELAQDGKERGEIIGKIFEIFYITEARRKIYAAEEYDKRIILGSSEFMDAPSVNYRPKHNFDVLEIDSSGRLIRVVQCKTAETDEAYSIEKVSGRYFSRFIKNPGQYIEAILKLSENGQGVTEAQMAHYEAMLEDLFSLAEEKSAEKILELTYKY